MPGLIQPKRFVILDPNTNMIHGAVVFPLSGESPRRLMFKEPVAAADWDAWQSGVYIQTALSTLTPDEREFLLTGMTPEEWNAAFPEED